MLKQTAHSIVRAAQRNLSEDDIEYVMSFGKHYHRFGAIIYYLRKRDLPETDLWCGCCQRLVGTAVVMSSYDGAIITVWRNRRTGLKHIRTWPHRADNPFVR